MLRSRYLLIAVTGFVAMVAQTVWYRYASQILGQSSLTVAAVVAMALAGLALGSHWGGRYGKLSAGTYVFGLGLMVLIAQCIQWYFPEIESSFLSAAGGQNWLWTLIVASPLLPINFCAGATFPRLLLSDFKSTTVGRLSAVETLGGCVGAVTAGCFAMQTFGLMPTFVGAGLLAVVIGVAAHERGRCAVEQSADEKIAFHVLAAVGIAGVASLGMEIVWQRLLILIVGTDSYSYTIVVTSYLLGIAIGAAAGALCLRARSQAQGKIQLSTVAILQVLVGISSLLVLLVVIYLASGAGQTWAREPALGLDVPLLKRFLLCIGLLLIPTSIQGAIFPLLVDAIAERNVALASPTSKIYATLAIGNVLGILLCGFYLIPWFGLQQSVVILGITSAVAAFLFLGPKLSPVLIVLTIGLFAICGHRLTQNESIGLAVNPEQTNQLYYREGPAHTVAVLAEKANPDFRRMTVDGIIIGQSGRNAEEKQLMLAHLPALLNYQTHPIKNAVVIGLGSGLLSGEVAAIAGVESVTTIELSPAVIEARDQFTDLMPNSPHATTQTIQSDGIHWLSKHSGRDEHFDAIISDGKSRPGHIGNAAFFSTEYYQSAAERLSENGKFVQWFSLDAAVGETKTVINTFANSFPHAAMAIAAPDSIYLIGSRQQIEMKSEDASAYLNLASSQSLRPYHWCSADDLRLMGWIQLDPENELLRRQAINSLEQPILERFSYDVSPETLTENKIKNLQWLKFFANEDETNCGLFTHDHVTKPQILTAVDASIDTFTIVLGREKNWLDQASSKLTPVLETLPQLHRGALLASSYLVAAKLSAEQRDFQGEAALLQRAGELSPADGDMQTKIGQRLLDFGDAESALPHFLNVIENDPKNGNANKGAAIALIKMQKIDRATRYYETAIADPAVRLDGQFVKLKNLFDKKDPTTNLVPEEKPFVEPTTEQEMLDRMKQLLAEPGAGQ